MIAAGGLTTMADEHHFDEDCQYHGHILGAFSTPAPKAIVVHATGYPPFTVQSTDADFDAIVSGDKDAVIARLMKLN